MIQSKSNKGFVEGKNLANKKYWFCKKVEI
jgi:hypothetical protein